MTTNERPTLIAILERLYGLEVNVSVSSFFDSGYRAKFGDEVNGWFGREMVAEHLEDLAEQLHGEALELIPAYREGFGR